MHFRSCCLVALLAAPICRGVQNPPSFAVVAVGPRNHSRIYGAPPAACSPPENATAFSGGDVAQCPGVTAADCCACCTANPLCNGYTLYKNVCYLKDVLSSPSQCDTCTSGALRAPLPMHHPHCATSAAHDFGPDSAGAMVATVPATNAGVCCTVCGEEPGCVSWTLFGGQCYLKAGYTGSKDCPDCISGMAPPGNKTALLPPQWEMQGMTFTGK